VSISPSHLVRLIQFSKVLSSFETTISFYQLLLTLSTTFLLFFSNTSVANTSQPTALLVYDIYPPDVNSFLHFYVVFLHFY
ncbi:hypothetical protein EA438_06995, partial [Streptococcus dysgalactiae subsp. dysgalactiae]|nr:hypothetical protein [Streptococcus dysgalactiae subsp. dysgalactiae]